MATRCLILSAMLLASSLLTAVAVAGPSDADRASARALAYEGYDALVNKDYAIAADRFSRADTLLHAPTLLLGLARAEVGLGKLATAEETYNRILREGVAPGAPPVFVRAVADARREVKKLAARIPSVVITVKGPDTAAVTIDGKPVAAAELGEKRPVDPGVHIIQASANEFATRTLIITLAEGEQETMTVELSPAPRIERPPFESSPLARSTPPKVPMRPSDTHDTTGSTQTTLGIVALSIGGVGLALGGVTGVLAVVQRNSFRDQCKGFSCPAELSGSIATYNTLGVFSTAGFIAGGTCALAGTILLLTTPKSRAEAWVTPLIGAGSLGLAGAF